MGNAFHMKPWPRWAQVLCSRLLGHQDRNYSDGNLHYAYCLRCGYLFGNPWGDRYAVANYRKCIAADRGAKHG
jgi:hypothetical protein